LFTEAADFEDGDRILIDLWERRQYWREAGVEMYEQVARQRKFDEGSSTEK